MFKHPMPSPSRRLPSQPSHALAATARAAIAGLLCATGALLAGCGQMAAATMPGAVTGPSAANAMATELDIRVSAAADVNPDPLGRPAPILVWVYELRAGAAFDTADYVALASGDRELLGADLLARDEFILRPGESRTLRRRAQAGTSAIAVVAGYRDLAKAEWRGMVPLPSTPSEPVAWYRAKPTVPPAAFDVQLGARGLRVAAVPSPTP